MLCAVLEFQRRVATSPYSKIGLTSEQYKIFWGETSLNSVIIPLIKPNTLKDLQQALSIYMLGLNAGQRTKPRSETDLSRDCKIIPFIMYLNFTDDLRCVKVIE